MPVRIKIDPQQGLTIACSRHAGITVQNEEQKKSILLLEEHGFLTTPVFNFIADDPSSFGRLSKKLGLCVSNNRDSHNGIIKKALATECARIAYYTRIPDIEQEEFADRVLTLANGGRERFLHNCWTLFSQGSSASAFTQAPSSSNFTQNNGLRSDPNLDAKILEAINSKRSRWCCILFRRETQSLTEIVRRLSNTRNGIMHGVVEAAYGAPISQKVRNADQEQAVLEILREAEHAKQLGLAQNYRNSN